MDSKHEDRNVTSEGKETDGERDLDEIPEGGFADIIGRIGPILQKYTRLRIYKFFKIFPRTLRYAFHMWLGSRVWKMSAVSKIVENGKKSLRLIFSNKSEKEIKNISRNSWRLLGYGMFSLLLVDLPNLTTKNMHKFLEFKGLEHVDKALKKGKGIIIASTHVGLIPAMYIGMALKGYKTNLIANVEVSAPLIAIRPIPGIRCIPTGPMSGPNSIRPKLHYVLKENELLYVFADFSQRKQMGIKFLGKMGHTPGGIPILAKETGAAVIPAFTYSKGYNKMVIRFLPEYKLVDKPTKKEFIGFNMLHFNNLMTWLIRRAPELYFEHTSYDMLKVYERKTMVLNADSRQVGYTLLDLAKEVIDTTYERRRKDELFYESIESLRKEVTEIPIDKISNKKFTAEFVIRGLRVKDAFLNMCNKAIDMGVDKAVRRVIYKAMQELVVLR